MMLSGTGVPESFLFGRVEMTTTAVVPFDRQAWARHYALNHMDVDPGTMQVYFLPDQAPEREIRLVEINDSMVEREAASREALDFGVDVDADSPARLIVVDLTPGQWTRVTSGELPLPDGWSLDGAVAFGRDDL